MRCVVVGTIQQSALSFFAYTVFQIVKQAMEKFIEGGPVQIFYDMSLLFLLQSGHSRVIVYWRFLHGQSMRLRSATVIGPAWLGNPAKPHGGYSS
jgi:hypothetical protein